LQKFTYVVVTHDGRSRQEWARTLNVVGHDIMSLMSWVSVKSLTSGGSVALR
jgi:hypothetical protein